MKEKVLEILARERERFRKEFFEFHHIDPKKSQTETTLNELEETFKNEL